MFSRAPPLLRHACHCTFQTSRAGSFSEKGEKRNIYDPQITVTTTATTAPVNPTTRISFRQRAASCPLKQTTRIIIGSDERIRKVARMTATSKRAGADIFVRKSPDQVSAVMKNQRLFTDWSNWK